MSHTLKADSSAGSVGSRQSFYGYHASSWPQKHKDIWKNVFLTEFDPFWFKCRVNVKVNIGLRNKCQHFPSLDALDVLSSYKRNMKIMVWSWFGHGLVVVWSWFGHGLVMVFVIIWSMFGHGLVMVFSWFSYSLVNV